MYNSSTIENDGKHVATVIERTECKKHKAPEGFPCWNVQMGSIRGFTLLSAVCGFRIKRAGYNGKISPTSLQLKTPGGRTGGPKR